MLNFATVDFLREYGARVFRDPSFVRVLDPGEDWARILEVRERFGVFALEGLDAVLPKIPLELLSQAAIISAGPQSTAIFSRFRVDPPSVAGLDLALRETRSIRNYREKSRALDAFYEDMAVKGVQPLYRTGLLQGVEEALLLSIADGQHRQAASAETMDFDFQQPIELAWGYDGGVLVIRVRDLFGLLVPEAAIGRLRKRFVAGQRGLEGVSVSSGLSAFLRHANAVFLDVASRRSANVYLVTDTTMRHATFVRSGRILATRFS